MNVGRCTWLAAPLVVALGVTGAAEAQDHTKPFTDLKLEPVAEGFTSPHYLVTPPGDDTRRFVVDLVGRITILDEDGTARGEPFLDVSDRMVTLRESYDERGLLGLAFHPDYQENGRFFVHYSAPLRKDGPDGWNNTSHISEFRVSEHPDRADPNSERVLMQIDQPQLNHNGSRVIFGPDGYLYVGLGDGGAAGDVDTGHPSLGNGQDVTTLLGSVLRIDVDKEPYGIPDDNPLVGEQLPNDADYSGDTVKEEIWAWGIRASWGMSFDRETDDLYVADVGQNMWEEVNRMKQPGNYGWRIKEGTHWFDPNQMEQVIEEGPKTGPMDEPLIDPVIEYRNVGGHREGMGICVIGGHVYRGRAIKELQGQYVFGDWSRHQEGAAGVVLVSRPAGKADDTSNQQWPLAVAVELDHYVLGFGEDADGELYVMTTEERGPSGTTGRVWKIASGR